MKALKGRIPDENLLCHSCSPMSTLISYSAQNTENILLENRSTIDKEYAHFYWQDGYGILSGFRPFGAAEWFDFISHRALHDVVDRRSFGADYNRNSEQYDGLISFVFD